VKNEVRGRDVLDDPHDENRASVCRMEDHPSVLRKVK
jgi:hypothetical protein